MGDMRPTASVLKLALAAREARQANLAIAADPIAIVGMGCRLPGGARSVAAYWRLLEQGVDAIVEVPRTRWSADAYFDADPARPGKTNTRWGSFLEDVDRFDAAFFGIAAREAKDMDPQHRLLLEVACEALDDAGQTAEMLQASATGAFFAVYNTDYLQGLHADRDAITAYATSGTAPGMAAGRLSYHFDLRGPSLVIDTACSSSLVAVHQACESLRGRTSDLALAGGVSLILAPDRTISLSKWGFMAPDGRCKPFDAGANGWVRGEGCGVVVLRRLSDALAAGDRVLAVIRGTAVNQDGRSTVMTAPNGAAQAAIIRAALANGRVAPGDVGYVEAHGTGTIIGDPIEFEALDEVLGQAIDALPCHVGAVKANLGHLEAAAGIAGLIKTILVLDRQQIPPQIHFSRLNPLLSFDGTRLRIAPEGVGWPAGERRRFAGVSAFGFSGTNAHVVLEEAPAIPEAPAEQAGAHLLVLSARSIQSLANSARTYADALAPGGELNGARLEDVCFTTGVRRHHHEHRLGVAGCSRDDLITGLRAFLGGQRSWHLASGHVPGAVGGDVTFVFSGQGSQWVGMARVLLDAEPVARRAFDECADLVARMGGPSLHDELAREGAESRLSSTVVAQPLLFAIQVSLAAQWRTWGIEPAAVVGHSIGEVAAAHVSGALTLSDAVRVVLARSRCMEATADRGRMLAAAVSRVAAEALVAASGGRLALAAINAPSAVVLSGDLDAIDACRARLEAGHNRCHFLDVRYPFHSHQMADACASLPKQLADLAPLATQVPFVSTVTGTTMQGEWLDAAYWHRNAVAPVEFHTALSTLIAAGHRNFVEIGPHPVLGGYVAGALDGLAGTLVVGTLHRDRDDRVALRAAAGALHVSGAPVDLSRVMPRGRVVSLPAYAWDRQRYWAAEFDAAQALAEARPPARVAVECALEREIETPWSDRRIFQTTVSATRPAFVADHRIYGQTLLPAASFVVMAASAAERILGQSVTIEDVFLHRPLVLEGDETLVQVGVKPNGDGPAAFEIVSRAAGSSGEWTRHMSGAFRVEGGAREAEMQAAPDGVHAPEATTLDSTGFYASLSSVGIQFGPAFRGVQTIAIGEHAASATVVPPALPALGEGTWVHPATLDACLQVAWGAIHRSASQALVPVAFGRIRCHSRQSARLVVDAHAEPGADGRSWHVNLVARGEDGEVVVAIDRLVLRPYVEPVATVEPAARARVPLHRIEWKEVPAFRTPVSGTPASWLVLADRGGTGRQLEERLLAQGHRCRLVHAASDEPTSFPESVDPLDAAAIGGLLHEFAGATSSPRRVVHLWSLDAGAPRKAAEELLDARVARGCAGLFHVLQAMADLPGAFAGVTLVTRTAQEVKVGAETDPLQALAWGLGRVADLEYPELVCRRIDLAGPASEEAAGLVDALLQANGERELAWRDRRWLAPRLVLVADQRAGEPPAEVLEIARRGSLDHLRLAGQGRRSPAAGEVELHVTASGLNFRDVLNTLGMYPGDAGLLGNECVGVITAVGTGVTGLRPGDQVVALGAGCFATYVTTAATLVVPRPAQLDALDAATVPIAFLTADYGLRDHARLEAGERVLVHAGAGGVGIAAIQIALRRGAQVYATAGSEEKRDYLRSLGVLHVADSRDVEFDKDIRQATGGVGVDVVLNSLAGEFIPRSLDLLTAGGRFVEIGKSGVWDESAVRSRRPDISYSVLYLGDTIAREPHQVSARLRELLELCACGALRPLPRRVFPLARASSAFRFMARGRHIGKLVLTPDVSPPWTVRPDCAYLVTGGTGALGLHAARWLVTRGARHLVLASRSARADLPAVDALRRLATVDVERCDLASAADVDRLVSRFGSTWPRLRGIVHAAGALHDGMLVRQTWADFRAGLGAKALGAWHLHRATCRHSLDFFICYSSLASVVGSLGQSSYAAANAFLDSLAARRRAEGLPAVAVSWGAWQDGGMAASLSDVDRQRQLAAGLYPLSDAEGDEVLDRLTAAMDSHLVAATVDWPAFVTRHSIRRPLLSGIVDAAGTARPDVTAAPDLPRFGAVLTGLRPADRRQALVDHVRARVLSLVGLPANRAMDERLGFREVGLDSLLAVELRNALQSDLTLSLPATLAFDSPTLSSLAGYLLVALGLGETDVVVAPTPPLPDSETALGEMSDEDAEALLEDELAALERQLRAK